MTVASSPLPRLDIPAKGGAWKLRHAALSAPDRRLAFQELVADVAMEPGERLSRMRTLVDMGLWEDLATDGEKSPHWVRRAVGLFEDAPLSRALPSHAQAEQGEFNQSFLRAISPGQPVEVLHLLIEAGADVDARDATDPHEPALIRALNKGLFEHTALLLRAGATVQVEDWQTPSPIGVLATSLGALHWDATKRLGLLELLMRHGADPNATPAFSCMGKVCPPLWTASAGGDGQFVQGLLAAGACVECPVGAAYEPVFVHLLENGFTSQWDERMRASFSEVARMLLDAGADIEQKGRRGMPALLHAACHWNEGAVEALLDWGASPHARDAQGASLMHHIVFNFEPDAPVVRRVLDLLAPDCWQWRDLQGRTPEDMLVERTREYGMEDYDTGPWQAVFQHHGLTLATPVPSPPRKSGPRL